MNQIFRISSNMKKNFLIRLLTICFTGIVFALAIFLVNKPITGPVIQADEGSHLANAAAIAGFFNDMASSYHAGYSLLISPAFFFSQNTDTIWFTVKAVNASLLFINFVALYWVSSLLKPNASLRLRLFAVCVVMLYPMWIAMSGYAFSQIAMAPFFVIVFAILLSALAGHKWCWWLLGPLSGFLYWIHPTGFIVGMAASIIAISYAIRRRSFYALLVPLLFIVTVISYRYGFTPWLHNRMLSSGIDARLHYPSFLQLLEPLISWVGLREIITRLSGHLFYLTTGTVGIFWLGFYSLFRDAWSRDRCIDKENQVNTILIAVFSAISVFGVLSLSVLSFSSASGANRLDHWMYGRYVEAFIAPILLVGLLRTSYKWLLWTVPVTIFLGLILWFGLDHYTQPVRLNISAFWQYSFSPVSGVPAWVLAAVALIILVALSPRKLGIFFISSIFIFANYLQTSWHIRTVNNELHRLEAANHIRDIFTQGTCVGFDHSKIDSYIRHAYWFDYGFILYNYDLKRMTYNSWLENCEGPLFTYDFTHPAIGNQVFPIVISPHNGPIALVKKHTLQAEMVYPILIEKRQSILPSILKSGWYDPEQKHVWSGPFATLLLPSPDNCVSDKCRAVVTASVFGASASKPRLVRVKGSKIFELEVQTSEVIKIEIPIGYKRIIQPILFEIPDADSPSKLWGTSDERVLGLAIFKIEIRSE